MTDAERQNVRLDTPQGCIRELTDCNSEVAGFFHDWAADAGRLKKLEKRYQRLYREALRTTRGKNAEERTGIAHAAAELSYYSLAGLDEGEPGLSEQIENLIGRVEEYKTRFAAIERRSTNAQSILTAHREAAKLDGFIPAEAARMGRAA